MKAKLLKSLKMKCKINERNFKIIKANFKGGADSNDFEKWKNKLIQKLDTNKNLKQLT